jgi:hypothetical protein
MRLATAALVFGVMLSSSAAARERISAQDLQDFFLGYVETPYVPEERGRFDLVLRGGGEREFHMTILPAMREDQPVYRVDVVDLHETTQAASWRLAYKTSDLAKAWADVDKTEAHADTGECAALLEPIRHLQAEFVAAKDAFSFPSIDKQSGAITLHPSIVQFSAIDERLIRLHIETQNEGPPALMLAAHRLAQALSTCTGKPIRALVAPTSKD